MKPGKVLGAGERNCIKLGCGFSNAFSFIKSYLQRGDKSIGEIDYGELIRSERFIKQAKEFDSKETKKFDLVMAKGYALMCLENYHALQNQHKEESFSSYEVTAVLDALDKWF